MIHTTACGVMLFRHPMNPEFLLVKHRDRYDLPKGHIEEGESELDCALREMCEETGITSQVVRMDPHFRYTSVYYPREKRFGNQVVHKTLVVFLGYLLEEVSVVVTEHENFEWISWAPPHQHVQTIGIDPMLDKVHAYMGTRSLSQVFNL